MSQKYNSNHDFVMNRELAHESSWVIYCIEIQLNESIHELNHDFQSVKNHELTQWVKLWDKKNMQMGLYIDFDLGHDRTRKDKTTLISEESNPVIKHIIWYKEWTLKHQKSSSSGKAPWEWTYVLLFHSWCQ